MAKKLSVLENIEFVGVPDDINVRRALAEYDPCFGKHFSRKAEECEKCRAPVIIKGKIDLLKNVCRAICSESPNVSRIRNLKSKDVKKFLRRGASPQEIFDFMVQDDYDEDDAREARKIMYHRFRYLKKEKDYPVPELPSLKELTS